MPQQDRSNSPYSPQHQHYQQGGANASYYNEAPPSQQQQQQSYAPGPNGPEGEKGLGSTLIGGAAGGIMGHKMGGGKLATAGGAALGAVAMNLATHAL